MFRLDWEQTLAGGTAPRRLDAAYGLTGVLACKSRDIDLDQPEAIWTCRIEFQPRRGPRRQRAAAVQPCGALRLTSNAWNASWTDLGSTTSGAAIFAIAPLGPRGEVVVIPGRAKARTSGSPCAPGDLEIPGLVLRAHPE